MRVPAQGRLTAADADALRDLLAQRPETGAWTSDLEAAIASVSSTPHVVAAASDRVALSLVLRGLDLQPGDEIIVPAYASAVVAEVIHSCGCRPVPVDVRGDSLHIDPQLVSAAVTGRTRAVVAVAAGGVAVDAESILSEIDPSRITLIEDACGLPVHPHAPVPGQVRYFPTGAHGGSPLNVGALIAFSDDALARRVRDLVNGISLDGRQPTTLHMAEGMTELAAAWQLALLGRLHGDWLRRCEMAMNYSAAFSSRLELEEPRDPADMRTGWIDYALRLNLQHLAVTRDELAGRLQRRGIPAAVRWLPIALSPVFQQRLGLTPESFPVARNEFLRELCLPIHASLTDAESDHVIETVFTELDAIAAGGPMPQALWRP